MDLNFHDNSAGCPRCFSTSRVLEGTINIWGNTIHILRGTNATAAQLARLQEVLRNAQQKQQPREEVVREVERAGFGAVAKQLLIPKDAAGFYALVGALLVAIPLLKEPHPAKHEDTTQIVNQVIEQIYQTPPPMPTRSAPAPAAKHPAAHGPKPGRNEPCPCGSGKKYKHCCGQVK